MLESGADPATTATSVLDEALALESRGAMLDAFDTLFPEVEARRDAELAVHALRMLARAGGRAYAMELAGRWRLERTDDIFEQAALLEGDAQQRFLTEMFALKGRLLKDGARVGTAEERARAAQRSAKAYKMAFNVAGSAYAAVNAAAMYALAGDDAAAEAAASVAMFTADAENPSDYYGFATRAECLLITGRVEEALDVFALALSAPGATFAARASTARQLRMLLAVGRDVADALKLIQPPFVAHCAGRLFDVAHADEARAVIAPIWEAQAPGTAFGCLAAGADIVFGEIALDQGAELNLVLFGAPEEVLAHSVRPYGEEWVPRAERLMERAASLVHSTRGGFEVDASLYELASNLAMGLTRLRAEALCAETLQMVLWDGDDAGVGTGRDAVRWGGSGGETIHIPWTRPRGAAVSPSAAQPQTGDRRLLALVFADATGFGGLTEAQVLIFAETLLAMLADAVQTGGSPHFANSWGDGLFFCFDDVSEAADACLRMQEAFANVNLAALGLPETMRLRVAAHFGVTTGIPDPITGRNSIYGTSVTTAARLEPVTPPGEIFVTGSFAAVLAVRAPDAFQCEFVGAREAAKGFGRMQLFRLSRFRE